MKESVLRKPPWIRTIIQHTSEAKKVRGLIRDNHLHTVCEESSCPNRGECYNRGTCTFLIMGGICTRGCRFCDVTSGHPLPLDSEEPQKVAESVKLLNLKHIVITTVDRDDLDDSGAEHFARTIHEVRKRSPHVKIEILAGDFKGSEKDLHTVLDAKPDVFAHNLETVERITPLVRDRRAGYHTSLKVLNDAGKYSPEIPLKSGIMVGLGETDEEVIKTLEDMREVGVIAVTIGQYLTPSNKHFKLKRFVSPELFDYYASEARKLGFTFVASAPQVRSSYRAEEIFLS